MGDSEIAWGTDASKERLDEKGVKGKDMRDERCEKEHRSEAENINEATRKLNLVNLCTAADITKEDCFCGWFNAGTGTSVKL